MNKSVVITGASSGIGLSFAHVYAREGYDVVIVARRKAELQKIAHELHDKYHVNVSVISIDLSLAGAADTLWEQLPGKDVDVFINNAGFGDLVDIVNADPDRLASMVALNISALTRLSQLAAIAMKQQGRGSIVNIASVLSFFPSPHGAVYGATKAYVLSFTEALSDELKGTGVYVTAICPGPTKTNFASEAHMEGLGVMNGKLPTGDDIARHGYQAIKKHKVIAVFGLRTKLYLFVIRRLLPRSVTRRISGYIHVRK